MISIPVNKDVVLRSYERADAQSLFDAVHRSRGHLAPWLVWVRDTTKPEHSLEYIEYCLHKAETQTELVLGIRICDSIVGSVGMHQWDHAARRAQLGYWIGKEYEGRGLVHQSLEKFIGFLFLQAGLNKLEIHFVEGNKRSARVAESLGFRVEGVLRQAVVRNGLLEDLVITGLLKDEWVKASAL